MRKITVLMPVYNAESYLEEAIESILQQSFKDFNLLIINDGSTDESENIITKFMKLDDRIIYEKNRTNIGLIKTLNRGINLVNTEYLVRMDSDDVAHTKKLEAQLKYMEENKEVNIVGTQSFNFSDTDQKRKRKILPTKSKRINTFLLFSSPLIHPSVMMRTSFLKKESLYYDEDYIGMEDYELWTRVASQTYIKNLKKALIDYRLNLNGITQVESKNVNERSKLAINIYHKYMNSNGIAINKDELIEYRKLVNLTLDIIDQDSTSALSQTILKIRGQLNSDMFDRKYFEYTVNRYYRINAQSRDLTYKQSIDLYNKIFNKEIKMDFLNKIVLFLRTT